MPSRGGLTENRRRPSRRVLKLASVGRLSGDPRTRRLIRTLSHLPLYSEQLKLDLANPADWFPWFLGASLFAKPIPAATALRTASLMLESGARTPRGVERTGWEGLVRILDRGGYVRYDFSTADKLLEIARSLEEPGLFPALAGEPSYPRVEERLTRIRGVGPKTVEIFVRELQGVWHSSPPWSEEAGKASQRLGIEVARWKLPPSRRRGIENGLVRLWIEHCKTGRWRDCPVGAECGCRPPRAGDH